MKKILLIVSLIFSVSAANSQSAEETLEWMKIKSNEIYTSHSFSCLFPMEQKKRIEFSHDGIALVDNSWKDLGKWNMIKEVKGTYILNSLVCIEIRYDLPCKSEKMFQIIRVSSEEMRDKFIKAIKHMATLKGAKMIDSDLF